MFDYTTGEEVRLGDIVRTGCECDGEETVAKIFTPGTEEAEHFLCSEVGGVLVEPISILLQPDNCDWEDLEFVSRAPDKPAAEPN